MSTREIEGSGPEGEPDLKRRQLLDAGGPIEDDETARRKIRGADVGEDGEITGFDPKNVVDIKHFSGKDHDDSYRMKPMGYFAQHGDLPMMRWLYVNGADAKDEDVDFWFPMYAAALCGHLEVCQWLCEHGADVRKRTIKFDLSPLFVTFDDHERRHVSRWLILRGALCKNDGSGSLDLDLVEKDLNRERDCILERHLLLEWANEHQRIREAFLVFLMGTLSRPTAYSPSSLRELLIKRLQFGKGAKRILDALPSDQHHQLWGDLIADKYLSCPSSSLCGSSGVLKTIGDFVGVVRGREARIIRQLTEILPELNVKLDQRYENDSSEEEDDSTSSEEDE